MAANPVNLLGHGSKRIASALAARRDGGHSRGRGIRFLTLLALPSLGLAVAATTVSTYLPVLLSEISGPTVTGILIGAEGLLALVIPPFVGRWSDSLETPVGGRMPFLLVGAPIAAAALVLIPLGSTLLAVVPLLLAFYVGYFVYYPPYRAEYPDLVPAGLRGRSQSAQKTLRELGLVFALVGGGLLLSVGREVPFAVATALLVATTIAFFLGVPSASRQGGARSGSDEGPYSAVRAVLGKRPVRLLLIANMLWELALGAIKTFVVLFFVAGLGRSSGFASAVLAGAAVAIVGGALVGGALGDRMGEMRLLRIGAAVYGVGLLAPLVSQSPVVLAVVAPTAFAGGVVMTLSFAAVMRAMPSGRHGSLAGAFELTRGVGTMLGPILAGIAIQVTKGVLTSTDGYAAMWGVASASVLLSLPVLGRAKAAIERAAN